MRVQLQRGDKDVEVELHIDRYQTDKRDEMFLGLLSEALVAMGYNEIDLLTAFKSKKNEEKS